ncbi:hypothetical protein [Bradyrhizobium sp. 150]|uniref:hypothetical protein n=1 Tax=Bradyrhizobium sp. 150 TaxID=2782625 RepID=UPI001FF90145|nr:hypothetical protein [Bradyrhizobium sp. 150]MCK1670326.1 hypothetical protein [Bradyrhizobium sp. 150]
MILLAVIATILAGFWTWIAVMANAMSDSPGRPFQGGLSVAAAWIAAIVLWAAWLVG